MCVQKKNAIAVDPSVIFFISWELQVPKPPECNIKKFFLESSKMILFFFRLRIWAQMKLNEHGVGPEQQPETERCLQSTRASINRNMTSKRQEFNGKNTSVCLSLCVPWY